jgi:hypothetical protein
MVGALSLEEALFDLGNTFVILFQFSVVRSFLSQNNFIAPQEFFKVPGASSPLSHRSL